jgi:hypothetical protein
MDMADDLRNHLAEYMREHLSRAESYQTFDTKDVGAYLADALLARFAIAGPLPDPDTDYDPLIAGAARWSIDSTHPRVYLSSEGQIDFTGPCYWNIRKGDDPRPFAAALIAAYIKAQEHHHE